MYKSDYAILMESFMDMNDNETRSYILSTYDGAIHEANQTQVLQHLTSNLYKKIVAKVDKIDYGTIARSKGDITKIENFDEMNECIDIIRDIVKQYNQDTEPLDTVSTAIVNIRDRKDMFTKAYTLNIDFPIIVYENMVLAIVSSVSFMIATSIEYIKNSETNTFEVALDKVAYKKTSENMLFNDLRRFNKLVKSGKFDKSMNDIIAANAKNFDGAAVLAVATILILSTQLLPILQELVYFYFYSIQSISDYFGIQADLLQLNAANVVYRDDLTTEQKDKIVKKQNKIVDIFRKISNVFAIDMKSTEKKATKEIAKDNKEKLKKQDVYTDSDQIESLF